MPKTSLSLRTLRLRPFALGSLLSFLSPFHSFILPLCSFPFQTFSCDLFAPSLKSVRNGTMAQKTLAHVHK